MASLKVCSSPEDEIVLTQDDLNAPFHIHMSTTERMERSCLNYHRLSNEDCPNAVFPAMKWRLAVINALLELREAQQEALNKNINLHRLLGSSKDNLEETIKTDRATLAKEKIFILREWRGLEADLNDQLALDKDNKEFNIKEMIAEEIKTTSQLQDQLFARFEVIKRYRQNRRFDYNAIPWRFRERLKRHALWNIVFDAHLKTLEWMTYGDGGEPVPVLRSCNILGQPYCYMGTKDYVLVPSLFSKGEEGRAMGYAFGSLVDPALNRRIAVSVVSIFEEALYRSQIVIVPDGSLRTNTPTEWKAVLLNAELKDNECICYHHPPQLEDWKYWYFRDFDGRRLKFENDNRPAARFLYFRFLLAYLVADTQGMQGFKEKLPPASVWRRKAGEPNGYMRRSILLALDKRTGHKLPRDLLEVGMFDDDDEAGEDTGLITAQHLELVFLECIDEYVRLKGKTELTRKPRNESGTDFDEDSVNTDDDWCHGIA